MAAAGGATVQVLEVTDSENVAADANEVAANTQAEVTRLLQRQAVLRGDEAQIRDVRNKLRVARESNSEEAKEEDKKRADKIKSINAERCSANETTKKADDGYREAIVRENDKLQAATKLSAEVTAQLQEAKKAAAAAAAKAIVAQKQALEAKLRLIWERQRTDAREEKTLKAELAALSNTHKVKERQAPRAGATPEVWELQGDGGCKDRINLPKGADVEIDGCYAPEGVHEDQAFALQKKEEDEERGKEMNRALAQVTPKKRSSAENQKEIIQEQEQEKEEEERAWRRRVAPRLEKRRLRMAEEDKEEEGEVEDEEGAWEHCRRTKQSGDRGASFAATNRRKCSICAMEHMLAIDKCVVCTHRRPATAIPRGSRNPQRREQWDAPVNGDGCDGTSSDEQDEPASDQGDGGGGTWSDRTSVVGTGSRRAGEATRQRRGVPIVNYAEDSDDDDGIGLGNGAKATASKTSAHTENSRNAPRTLSGELRLEMNEDEALPDDVSAFRRLVRSAVKSFYREDFVVYFRDAVDLVKYSDYMNSVAEPMDLAKIMFKLRQGEYDSREGRDALKRDINLIPENSEAYNGKGVISQNAHQVARKFIERLHEN